MKTAVLISRENAMTKINEQMKRKLKDRKVNDTYATKKRMRNATGKRIIEHIQSRSSTEICKKQINKQMQ